MWRGNQIYWRALHHIRKVSSAIVDFVFVQITYQNIGATEGRRCPILTWVEVEDLKTCVPPGLAPHRELQRVPLLALKHHAKAKEGKQRMRRERWSRTKKRESQADAKGGKQGMRMERVKKGWKKKETHLKVNGRKWRWQEERKT